MGSAGWIGGNRDKSPKIDGWITPKIQGWVKEAKQTLHIVSE